jgi:single-strand DNA-binding protein
MKNLCILIGHVGETPKIKNLSSGDCVANFSLATSENYTNKQGEKIETVEWHNIVCWRKLAEIVEKYVHKGDHIYIEGKITHGSWQDKEGITRYTTEIVAKELKMLGGHKSDKEAPKSERQQETQNQSESSQESDDLNDPNDQLPF